MYRFEFPEPLSRRPNENVSEWSEFMSEWSELGEIQWKISRNSEIFEQKISKVDPKVKIFDIFDDFSPIKKASTKLFIIFWYTVDPWEHVGAFSKKIQVKKFFIKINVSPLGIGYYA